MNHPAATLRSVCGVADLDAYGDSGVTHVLSILDPGWADPTAFERYPAHHRVNLRFHDAVESGHAVLLPERRNVEDILAFGQRLGTDLVDGNGGHLLIHCQMGISRSTAAMVTLLAQAFPREDDELLFDRLLAIRPQAWPNLLMVGFADELLDRGGRMVAALGRVYAGQLARRPDLADERRRQSRGREVELGLESRRR